MNRKDFLGLFIPSIIVIFVLIFLVDFSFDDSDGALPHLVVSNLRYSFAAVARSVSSPWFYNFAVDGRLDEVGRMDDSSSPYWWLNSGAYMYLKDGTGRTIQGNLGATNKWRVAYAASNPVDTDNGLHPQNLFRLFTRSRWQNARSEAYFRILKDNLSVSPNRAASNGILLPMRYLDGYNLYYGGLRVDGAAVIKKKISGQYYTLGYKKIFEGTYQRDSTPNLLPKDKWIGVRFEVVNGLNGIVTLRLYTDVGRTGHWTLALQSVDDGKTYGGAAISSAGYAGIRADFMDLEFDDFRLTSF